MEQRKQEMGTSQLPDLEVGIFRLLQEQRRSPGKIDPFPRSASPPPSNLFLISCQRLLSLPLARYLSASCFAVAARSGGWGLVLRGKVMAVCTTEGSSWMGVWVSSAKAPSRCRYGQSNKGRTCHGLEGRPEPPSPRQGSLDALCSGRAPSHPTSLILGFCPPPPPTR